MARIIPYQQQTITSGGITAAEVPTDPNAGALAGIAAQALGAGGQLAGQIADRDGKAEAAKVFSQAEIDEQNNINTQSGQRAANPDGFGKEFVTGLDERNQTRLDGVSGPARQYLSEMLPRLRTSFGKQAGQWEFGARQSKVKADTLTAYDNTFASLYAGTISKDEAKARADALITSYGQSGLADPQDLDKLRASASRDASWYSLMRTIKQNPVVAKAALSGQQHVLWDSATTTMHTASDALVQAVFAQESGNGANKGPSSAGASGLAQIMPGTAREIAADLGDTSFDGLSDREIQQKLIVDDALSAKMGKHYLDKMLDKYGGDVVVALAAYNAGPGRVDASLAKVDPKTQGYDAFIATLPTETQNYIPAIMGRTGAKMGTIEMQDTAGLSPDDLIRAGNIADSEVRSNQAEHRAGLEMDVQNDLALYSEGEVVSDPKTLTDFLDAYNPDEAMKQYNRYTAAAETGAAIGKMKGLTNTQIAEQVQSMQPTDTSDPNYANKRNGWLAATAAGQQILTQRANDPGGYAQKNIPSVRQAWIDYGNDPQTLGKAVSTTLGAQDLMGIPEGQQDALPKQVRNGMIDSIQNATPSDAFTSLHQLAASTGDNWSQVFKSISTGDGALSRDYQTLALIDDPSVGQAFAAALKLNKSEGASGSKTFAEGQLGKDVVKEIPQQMTEQMADFLQTISWQGGDTLVNQQMEAATQSVYMMAPTLGLQEAQSKVVNAFVGRYDVINRMGNIVARAPVGQGDRMARVAEWYRTDAPDIEFALPGGDPTGGYDKSNLSRDLRQMRENSMWVTTPDESGWMLRSPAGNVMRRPDGSPVTLSFDDLEATEKRMNDAQTSVSRPGTLRRQFTTTPGGAALQ